MLPIPSFFKKISSLFSTKSKPLETDTLTACQTKENIKNSYTHLSQKTAEDIMIPRAEIVAIPSDFSFKALITRFQKSGHSRLPVFNNTLDTIYGMVHIKDLLAYFLNPKDFFLGKFIRKVLFASPSVQLNELLLDMQQSRTHMALIIDEYGGIDGLITIENILEELVGDIRDEHEEDEEPLITKNTDSLFLTSGKAPIELVETTIGIKFPAIDIGLIETIAGYVSFLSGTMPKENEIITEPKTKIKFEIIQASPRTIDRIKIHLPLHKKQ